MPCDAIDFLSYQGTALRKFPDSSAYFYVTERMEIDADGAPNAYHPQDRGIDALGNAGFPNGAWKSVLVVDPVDSSRPFVQTTGPFAGFFLAGTTLEDPMRPVTDPARYLDATHVPYIVFPGDFNLLTGTGSMGDFAIVRNLSNGRITPAIVADIGPSHAPLGEVSVRLAENLGGSNVSPRTGSGKPRGPFLYVLFPRSHANPKWPLTPESMSQRVDAAFSAIGGWDRILPCIPPH